MVAKSKVSSKCKLFFRPGGILVCKLEGASFWEKTPGADYLPHHLNLPEGTVYIVNLTEKDNRNYNWSQGWFSLAHKHKPSYADIQ